jgi:hypothetical protein
MMRMIRTARPWPLRHPGRAVALLLLPLALGGCLARTASLTPVFTPAVATVPSTFLEATPAAEAPPAIPPGRYTLGQVTPLPSGDPRAGYATALLGQNAKFIQVALRVDGLRLATPPEVAYELVSPVGVFAALAAGEWEQALQTGNGYSADGVLLFVVPRDLRTARLEIVDYYYPRALPTGGIPAPTPAPLVRRVLATFTIERLP